jgi:hypothetical protein
MFTASSWHSPEALGQWPLAHRWLSKSVIDQLKSGFGGRITARLTTPTSHLIPRIGPNLVSFPSGADDG